MCWVGKPYTIKNAEKLCSNTAHLEIIWKVLALEGNYCRLKSNSKAHLEPIQTSAM